MKRFSFAQLVLAFGFGQVCVPAGAAVFSDVDFDLSSYTVSKFSQSGAIDVSQTLDGGNPGKAVAIDVTAPPPGFENSYSRVFLFNKSFVYDPQIDGAIASISWTIDKYTQIILPPGTGVYSTAGLVLLQDGKIYDATVVLPSTQGTFLTAGGDALTATSFNLITDTTTGAVDATAHPNFSSGVMQFGTRAGFGVAAGSGNFESLVKLDNFSITIASAVPEPETYALLVEGLAVLAVARRRA